MRKCSQRQKELLRATFIMSFAKFNAFNLVKPKFLPFGKEHYAAGFLAMYLSLECITV